MEPKICNIFHKNKLRHTNLKKKKKKKKKPPLFMVDENATLVVLNETS